MNLYSQKDKLWADDKIGLTNLTLKNYGCLITCLAIIDGRTPKTINQILTQNDCYEDYPHTKTKLDDYLVGHQKAARALRMQYEGFSKTPKGVCIACTNYFANKGYPTHFFVWTNSKGMIIDPLDGKMKLNKYGIISYRLYSKGGSNG